MGDTRRGRKDPYKFGQRTRQKFLAELARTGRHYDSARAAGVSYRVMKAYRAGGTHEDLEFEEQVQEALDQYTDLLRREIHRRGVEGWVERGVFSKDGEHLGDVVKYSDQLLMAQARKHDPSYRDKVSVDGSLRHAGAVNLRHEVDLSKLSREGRDRLRAVLRELVREE